jgi:hypothetical protein
MYTLPPEDKLFCGYEDELVNGFTTEEEDRRKKGERK